MLSFRRLFQKFEPYDNSKKYKIKNNPNKFILLRLFKNFRSSSCFLNVLTKKRATLAERLAFEKT